MSKSSIINLYKSQITDIESKMKSMQARFETGEHKNCKKYPSFMHEELHNTYMDGYKESIAELEKLILDLN